MQRSDAVDVVMPVYNAPELTRRAIDSLYAHLGERIAELVAWDDCSAEPTRAMARTRSYSSRRSRCGEMAAIACLRSSWLTATPR